MRVPKIRTEDLLLAAKVREIAFLHQQKARSLAFKSWLDDIEANTSGDSPEVVTKNDSCSQARAKVFTPEKRINFLMDWDAANPVENFALSAIDELTSYARVILNSQIQN
jgi:hypothetical protein